MYKSWVRLSCFVVAFASSALPAAAQGVFDAFTVAQAAPAPKRALPIPNKPVSEDENAKAARINNWTIGLAGGLLEGTFSKYAADLGKALDDGDNLRVLPIISYGAVGNVTDLIYLKGVDFAITYADVLDHFKNVEKIPGIERARQLRHPDVPGRRSHLVRPEIKTIEDLAGKKVGFNTVGSAANYTGGIVFDRLGIKVERVFHEQRAGARGHAQGRARRHRARRRQAQRAVHQVQARARLPLPAASSSREKFEDYYMPAELTSADYPNLIPQGQPIQTISVPALLAVYNWKPDTGPLPPLRALRGVSVRPLRQAARGRPTSQAGRRSTWPGTIPGWTRFPPAQEMLEQDRGQRPRGIDPALARTQAARAAPEQPGRAGAACSSSSWSGASNRSAVTGSTGRAARAGHEGVQPRGEVDGEEVPLCGPRTAVRQNRSRRCDAGAAGRGRMRPLAAPLARLRLAPAVRSCGRS